MSPNRPTVFLDRDGVLIEDVDLLTSPANVRLLPGAGAALDALSEAGFQLIVVSNQPVIARGLVTEADVERIHEHIQDCLRRERHTAVDAFYFCPHHPNATLPKYRVACDCRKPRPGLLLRAAEKCGCELGPRSVMVGDRVSDIIAGQRAGCATVLVETGRQNDPLIETPDQVDVNVRPDFTCADLSKAAEWIIQRKRAEDVAR